MLAILFITISVFFPTVLSLVVMIVYNKSIESFLVDRMIKKDNIVNIVTMKLRKNIYAPVVSVLFMYTVCILIYVYDPPDRVSVFGTMLACSILYYWYYLSFYFQVVIVASEYTYVFGPSTLFRAKKISNNDVVNYYKFDFRNYVIGEYNKKLCIVAIDNIQELKKIIDSTKLSS